MKDDKKYLGYMRVSSREQKEDRQRIALLEMGVLEKNIFMDKLSGKNFERPQYKKMLKKLDGNSVLFVKSIDRLGRNYKDLNEQWRIITKEKGADIVVIDMSLLDTRREKNLMGTLISDIVLALLSYVAENERMNIKQRQAEGIAAAKARGIKFGRPSLPLPDNFYQVHKEWRAGKMSVTQAALEKQYLLEKLEKLRAEAENCLKSTSPNKQYFWWKIPWEQLERYLLISLSEPTGNCAWRFETRWECVKRGDVQDLLFWEEGHFSDFSDNSTMEFFETSKYSAEERSELMKRYADSQKRSDRDAWYWYHGKSIYSMDTGKLYDSIDSYLLSADESGGETWERIELLQGGKIEVPEEESAEKRFDEIIEEINNATGTTFKNANVTEENEKFVCTYVSEQGNKIFLTWNKSNACLSGVEVSGSRGEEWVAAKDVLVGLPELGLELENAAIFTGEVKRRLAYIYEWD